MTAAACWSRSGARPAAGGWRPVPAGPAMTGTGELEAFAAEVRLAAAPAGAGVSVGPRRAEAWA